MCIFVPCMGPSATYATRPPFVKSRSGLEFPPMKMISETMTPKPKQRKMGRTPNVGHCRADIRVTGIRYLPPSATELRKRLLKAFQVLQMDCEIFPSLQSGVENVKCSKDESSGGLPRP